MGTGIEASLVPVFSNLGVAGFAIYILWCVSESNKAEREKNAASAQLEREKHLVEVNEMVKMFNIFQEKVRSEIMGQLNKNTTAFDKVLDHITRHNS